MLVRGGGGGFPAQQGTVVNYSCELFTRIIRKLPNYSDLVCKKTKHCQNELCAASGTCTVMGKSKDKCWEHFEEDGEGLRDIYSNTYHKNKNILRVPAEGAASP